MGEHDNKSGWTLVMEDHYPFDLRVIAHDGREIVYLRRCAHASDQKTLEDVRDAVGFPHQERPEIVALIKRQEDEARLMASAPALLSVLRKSSGVLRDYMRAAGPLDDDDVELLNAIDAAITQAEGDGQ